MSNILKYGALAALMGASVNAVALADTAETKGGLVVRSDDGRFETRIGGRLMYDYYIQNRDKSAGFGSGLQTDNGSGGFFRQARVSFSGKAYGWDYLLVPDFSQNTGGIGTGAAAGSTAATAGVDFQELYVQTDLGPGKIIVGQFKPFRGIEELTSSNEITMMERPFTTASGLYARQFVQGLGYTMNFGSVNVQLDLYNPREDNQATTSAVGYGGRVTFAPLMTEGSIVHLGLSAGIEGSENGVNTPGVSVRYGGRRGQSSGTFVSAVAGGDATYMALEAATVLGPVYLQAEYGMASFEQAAGAGDHEAVAYHVLASYNLGGESKAYDAKKGVFKSIKPVASWGAVELTARLEVTEDGNSVLATDIDTVSTVSLGANYYANPNVRFMLNYNMGSAERVDGSKDEPETLGLRTHIYW